MIRNYINIAWRNLRKYPLFSFINLFGLASGMAVCLLAMIPVKDAFEYDRFHPYPKRTYRIITDAGDTLLRSGKAVSLASAPLPLAPLLAREFSFVEKTARTYQGIGGEITAGGRTLDAFGSFADSSFYEVFGFKLASGQPAVAPQTVVLTHETARRFFGSQNPINKPFVITGKGPFTVTGVLDSTGQKTHLQFQFLASMASVPVLERSGALPRELDNWTNNWTAHTYVLLRPGTNPAVLEQALQRVTSELRKRVTYPAGHSAPAFRIQRLDTISPARELLLGGGEPALGGLLAIIALALAILLLAGFNYTNLTLARSLSRTREVGVRKVAGAGRAQLIGQFLAESLLLAFLSFGLAYSLLLGMEQLPSVYNITKGVRRDGTLWLGFMLFTAFVGLGAGYFPARILSAYQPVQVLKGVLSHRQGGGGFRKGLLVVQFAVSMVFLIFVAVIYRQASYMANDSTGFNRRNLLNISLAGSQYRLLATELAQVPGVTQIGGTSEYVGTYAGNGRLARDKGNYRDVSVYAADRSYVDELKLRFVAGQNLPASAQDSAGHFVLLNEKALAAFQLGDAHSAVGRTLWLNDSTDVQVAGVVADFRFQTFTFPISPLVIRYQPRQFRYAVVQVAPEAVPAVRPALEKVWQRLNPGVPFEARWFDEQLYDRYFDGDDLTLFGVLVGMALSIACLGLLGMVTYTTQLRTKEVGVRKVLGASVPQLTWVLSWDFVRLLLVAGAIALPLGYWSGLVFLRSFEYHISIGVGTLLGCLGAVLLIGIGTIGWQTYRAAQADPVKSLRTE